MKSEELSKTFKLSEMFDPNHTADMFAAVSEGTPWKWFKKLNFDDNLDWDKRRQQAIDEGYVILIIPSQHVLYDYIANVIQHFDENGRGDIIKRF